MEPSRIDDLHVDMRQDKRTLRAAMISRRATVSSGERTTAGHALAGHVDELMDLAAVRRIGSRPPARMTVAAYVSMGSEIPLGELLQALLDHDCRVLVPRLGTGLEIGWSELDALDDLRTMDRAGRPQEPGGVAMPPDALGEADMIVMPALAVDHGGTRLGRGGGWYDRALEHRAAGVPLIAVVWPWEVVDGRLPRETHDVAVNGVLTPDGLAMFV